MYKMPVTFLSLCILVFDKKRAQQVCFACRNFCLTRLQLSYQACKSLVWNHPHLILLQYLFFVDTDNRSSGMNLLTVMPLVGQQVLMCLVNN